jgi:hypothetical protein
MAAIQLEGLAETWEAEAFIRHSAREHGQLVKWPNPKAVGIPSMKLILSIL